MTLADEMNEKDEVTTSSPGPTPSRWSAAWRPVVPLEQATAKRVPTVSAKARSNWLVTGPRLSRPERSTSSTSSSSRSSTCGLASGMVRVVTTRLAHRRSGREVEQLAEALVASVDDVEEDVLHLLGDRSASARRVVVNRRDRRHLAGRAAQEDLVAEVEVRAHEVDLAHLPVQGAKDAHDGVARDARQAGGGRGRGVDDAVADDEDVLARAVGDVSRLVQEDRLLVAAAVALELRQHRVDVLAGGLGGRRKRVGTDAAEARDLAARALLERLIAEVGAPAPDGDAELDRVGGGIETHRSVAAKRDRPDV